MTRCVEKFPVHPAAYLRVMAATLREEDGRHRPPPPEPTCVCLHATAEALADAPVAVRFGSPEEVDAAVADLRRAQALVWPWHTPEGR